MCYILGSKRQRSAGATTMDFPGHVIAVGETDPAIVRAIVGGLAAKGLHGTSPDGVFDGGVKALVSAFQSTHVDALARPLHIDGEVGQLTWSAIFGSAPVNAAPTGPAGAALGIAISQIGVREAPPGSNRGREVDDYLRSVGLDPAHGPPGGYSWCMSFVYWCFHQAAAPGATPFPRKAACLDVFATVRQQVPDRIITRADAIAAPGTIRPGMVFILDHGGGHGHTGFVRQSAGGALKTVEGNTNTDGSNNGVGVFELNRRSVMDRQLLGFIDFTR